MDCDHFYALCVTFLWSPLKYSLTNCKINWLKHWSTIPYEIYFFNVYVSDFVHMPDLDQKLFKKTPKSIFRVISCPWHLKRRGKNVFTVFKICAHCDTLCLQATFAKISIYYVLMLDLNTWMLKIDTYRFLFYKQNYKLSIMLKNDRLLLSQKVSHRFLIKDIDSNTNDQLRSGNHIDKSVVSYSFHSTIKQKIRWNWGNFWFFWVFVFA